MADATPNEAEDLRLTDVDFVFPIHVGTVAFWLGKKASEYLTHKWTVYVRGINNNDITHVVKKVTIHLHSSFPNPTRVLETPPFELTETGWGEFDMKVSITFQDDAGESDVDMFHRLKLFEVDGGQSTKRPVVREAYEELVFVHPRSRFYHRVSAIEPPQAPPSQLLQYFPQYREDEEVARLKRSRAELAHMVETLRAQFDV